MIVCHSAYIWSARLEHTCQLCTTRVYKISALNVPPASSAGQNFIRTRISILSRRSNQYELRPRC